MEASHPAKPPKTICRRWPGLVSAVEDFYKVTIELIQLLEIENDLDRDVKIIKIQELLEQREGFMKRMNPPFSQEEQELGKQFMELNKKVSLLLTREKITIQKDLNQLKKKKQTATKYSNPYESLSTMDGVFYDRRK